MLEAIWGFILWLLGTAFVVLVGLFIINQFRFTSDLAHKKVLKGAPGMARVPA